MSNFINPVELRFGQINVRGKLIENSPFKHAGSDDQRFAVPGLGVLSQSTLAPGPLFDFIEFRFPHHQKKEFAAQFAGASSGALNMPKQLTLAKTVTIANAQNLYLTYGKMNTYQGSLLKFDNAMDAKNGADAGMTVAGGIQSVVVAAGASVAAAPLTLGLGLGVAAIAISAGMIKNHMANLKAKQVFVRVSRSPLSSTCGKYFSYEDKIYATAAVPGSSVSYAQLMTLVSR